MNRLLKISAKVFSSIFLLSLLFTSCKSHKHALITETKANLTAVDFVKSDKLSKVLDIAKEQNKLVFVDFYTDWCLPCQLMDEDVFTDPDMADFLNDNFINYKINAEKGGGPDLSVIFEVKAYPTLLFLDHKGRVILRKQGAAYHTELKAMGLQALSHMDVGMRD